MIPNHTRQVCSSLRLRGLCVKTSTASNNKNQKSASPQSQQSKENSDPSGFQANHTHIPHALKFSQERPAAISSDFRKETRMVPSVKAANRRQQNQRCPGRPENVGREADLQNERGPSRVHLPKTSPNHRRRASLQRNDGRLPRRTQSPRPRRNRPRP
jgi:hypothetical protein